MKNSELIVMLTQNDLTVKNAEEIFHACSNTSANYWGVKEQGLTQSELCRLFEAFKKHGKAGVLEVVAYTEDECIAGAKLAVDCACDMLIGTVFYDSVKEVCQENGIKYFPYVGKLYGRPTVLDGSLDGMLNEGQTYIKKGADGVTLLGYRYKGDSFELSKGFAERFDGSVCLAGSINSYKRLDEIKLIAPDFFTIGGAFFEHRFAEDFSKEINAVCSYIKT